MLLRGRCHHYRRRLFGFRLPMAQRGRLRGMKWVLVLMVLMGGSGYGWVLNRPGADAPLYQAVALSGGELFQSVTASGQLNPVVKVEVGSQISGSIQKLFADFNSPVKEAQIVARIDPATYEAAL